MISIMGEKNMTHKKMIIITILTIFIIGMCLSPVTASHTFQVGKYKATVSDKQYKKLKKASKNEDDYYSVSVKTKNTYKFKKYKYKTITKKKWKYKKVLEYKDVWSSDWSDYTTYEYNVNKYWKNGWTWYGSTTTDEDNGHVHKYFSKFKKKVPVKVKVKTKKYSTVKKHYRMEIESNGDAWIYKGYNVVKVGAVNL